MICTLKIQQKNRTKEQKTKIYVGTEHVQALVLIMQLP